MATLFSDWQNDNEKIRLAISKQIPTNTHIVADQTLTQAIHNILSNAVDANADMIQINYFCDRALLKLLITDNGQGLSEDAQKHAGEPFFTTKAPNTGMGLGLYLAKATLSRYGGELKLANAEQGGAEVTLLLPLEKLLC